MYCVCTVDYVCDDLLIHFLHRADLHPFSLDQWTMWKYYILPRDMVRG